MDWMFLKNFDMTAYQVNSGKAFSSRTVTASKAKYGEVYKILPGPRTFLTCKSDTHYFKSE
jgi:hypothetical protein